MSGKLPNGFLHVIPECEALNEAQTAQVNTFVATHLATDTIPECYAYLNDTPRSEEDKFIIGYKYLMARKWKMEDAVKMFTDTVKWRESHQYHKKGYFPCAFNMRGYDQAMLEDLFKGTPRSPSDRVDEIVRRIKPGYKFAIHKWDKQGHPILIDLSGRLNPKRTVAALKTLSPPGQPMSEPFVLLRAYQNELCQYLIRARDTAYVAEQQANGVPEPVRRVTSVTGIMDMSGLGMEHTSTELIEAIKQMLGSTQAYYPEMSYRTFVVNCSPIVMFGFNLIKGWMDVRARNKLVFCSPEDTPAVLRAVIDAENLPKFLGGECECDGGCICEDMAKGKDEPEPMPILGERGDVTTEFTVGAGHVDKKAFAMVKDQTVAWHWDVPHEGQDVLFSATFTPKDGSPAVTVHAAEKLANHKGEWAAAVGDGELVLSWSNETSWLKSRMIRARVAL